MPATKKVAAKKVAAKKSLNRGSLGVFIQPAPTKGNFTRTAVRKAVKAARKSAR